MITKELIERFLRNECTLAERQAVLDYFKRHPDQWDRHLDDDDWERFEELSNYEDGYAESLFEKVRDRTFVRRRRMRIGWLSAAAVLLLIAGTWWLSLPRQKGAQAEAKASLAKTEGTGRHHVSNLGVKVSIFMLPDGTTVELSPKSSIDYSADQAAGGKRMVFLDGKASFRVTKDKSRPFVVYSGDIATTVLGTYFTVEAFAEASETRVALHEGRVVVKSVETAKHRMAKDEYLFPGDLLVYRKSTGQAVVTHAIREDRLVRASPPDSAHAVRRPDWYQFDGQGLPEVLDQLSAYYQVTIYYHPAQLGNRYFTGRIEQTDSLENILNDIALLHHLTIRKQKDSSYLITTKSH